MLFRLTLFATLLVSIWSSSVVELTTSVPKEGKNGVFILSTSNSQSEVASNGGENNKAQQRIQRFATDLNRGQKKDDANLTPEYQQYRTVPKYRRSAIDLSSPTSSQGSSSGPASQTKFPSRGR